MHLLKADIYGTYKPTMFSILINDEQILNEKNQIKEEFSSIFFHEYIHYLQDFLTSFGLRNIASLLSEYSQINHEIIHSPQPSFSVPFTSKLPHVQVETELFRLLWGTSELGNDDRDFVVVGMDLEAFTLNPKLNHELVSIRILYTDNFEEDAFYLGAVHFLENMTDLLVRRNYLADETVIFPYKVIEKLTRSIFISGNFSDRNLILIMEAALESHDPARYYFEFHLFCINNNFSFDELSINKFKATYSISWKGHKFKFDNFYFANAITTRKGFEAIFIHDKLVKLKEWAQSIIGNSIKVKRSKFSFVELLDYGTEPKILARRVNRFVRALGTPIITDKNGNTYVIPPKNSPVHDHMIYLLGIEAVIIALRESHCTIYPYCSSKAAGQPDITDESCKKSPWDRAKKEPLCIFGQLWIMWGFVKKKVS
ncbi:hypothetical protein [Paraflavitalea sp. CAU 1676]|uniref:hypothetical protein n=1 Tax=Paraflavitalea sp. CAU 1676 TaxID=3032598 RepID=UPI0023DAE8E6|nr:hypothetical protein [Paraflavitalea sp. CAU 1676]MDF2188297.1 hypothetical protein [Paraflavitalea sp. CAU 1676]